MPVLALFDAAGEWQDTLVCDGLIRQRLEPLGLLFGRIDLPSDLPPAGQDAGTDWRALLGAPLQALWPTFTPAFIDRVSLAPDPSDGDALRPQFIREHHHDDAEVRLFLAGSGAFYLRAGGGLLALLCDAGDWLYLPPGLAHGFDAGAKPDFDALRLFADPQGWQAHPTGRDWPAKLPRFDALVDGVLAQTGLEDGE
ncbi:MAG: hypothetical protein JOY84_20960 [Curvibacter sp.]|nr:hypothetical protein [Curvibacter sp.]